MGKTFLAMWGVAGLLSLPLAGCENGTDDVGGEPAAWMPADAGIPPRPDASYGEDGSASASDRVCYEAMPLPGEALPRCTAATRDCVESCPEGSDGDSCRNDCWASDETPRYTTEGGGTVGCNDCIFSQLIACLDRDGCDTEVAAFYCCIVDHCPGGGGDSCIQDQCADELGAMFMCGTTLAPECFDVTAGDIGECYTEADAPAGDGGMDDASMGDAEAPAPDVGTSDAGVDGGAS